MSDPSPSVSDGGDTAPHVEVRYRFAIIPEALLYDTTISASAVRLYGVLVRHGTDPSNCYPSHRRCADILDVSHRSIPGWIAELEGAGWLNRKERRAADGSILSNGYVLHGRAQGRGPLAAEQGPPLAAEQGAPSPPRAPKESKVNESNKNEKPLSSLSLVVPDAFADFWAAYPNKREKPKARKAWDAALKRGVDPQMIIEAARRYAADPNREDRYTKYPQGWLTAEAWNDPPLASRTGRTQSFDDRVASAHQFVNNRKGTQ